MAIEGFNEIFNVVYLAKELHDMGKFDLVKSSFSDSLDYDTYYENMYGLIGNIFERHTCRYYESLCGEIHNLSDPAIVDFFILAGQYGRRNNIPDEDNRYIKEAKEETDENLYICNCLNWKLMGHTEPKRPFHSRLALFISHDCGCLDLGVLAHRLVELHDWFSDSCVELRGLLAEIEGQTKMEEVAMAA